MKTVISAVVASIFLVGTAYADSINAVETGDTRASATSLDGHFTLPSPANAFGTEPTASVNGFHDHLNDIDWFSFTASAGQVMWADVDGAAKPPFEFDSVLSLFDANGTLLAYGDDSRVSSGVYDPGSASQTDSFIGEYTFAAAGTYYLAISNFPNIPNAEGTGSSADLSFTGLQAGRSGSGITGATFGDDSFSLADAYDSSSSYTLHVSLVGGQSVNPIPEPGTFALFGFAALGFGVHRRRRTAS